MNRYHIKGKLLIRDQGQAKVVNVSAVAHADNHEAARTWAATDTATRTMPNWESYTWFEFTITQLPGDQPTLGI